VEATCQSARTQFLLDEKLETKAHVIGALIKTNDLSQIILVSMRDPVG